MNSHSYYGRNALTFHLSAFFSSLIELALGVASIFTKAKSVFSFSFLVKSDVN